MQSCTHYILFSLRWKIFSPALFWLPEFCPKMRDCIHLTNSSLFSILSYFMTFIPPGETIVETKKCRISGKEFLVTDKDLEFYAKISPVFAGQKYLIPSPTLCPDERARSRMIFRNFHNLYHRHSDLSNASVISMYGPHADVKVYSIKEWWSDDWDPHAYGRDFSFEKTLSDNLPPLHREVPRMALMNRESENCDYANLCWLSKNCYLVSWCVRNEECLFGHIVWKSKNIVDGLYMYESENCYQCIDCVGSHTLQHCQDCKDSRDCYYCSNCSGCSNCIGCSGLKNKSYHVFNKPVSPDVYKQKLHDIYGRNLFELEGFVNKVQELKMSSPTPHIQWIWNENVSWNAIYFSKNCHECFDVKRSENLKFCRTTNQFQNSQDINYSPDSSEYCYQWIAITGSNVLFSHNCTSCNHILYCDNCYTSQNCFACVWLKNKKNCILNKSYSTHEYEQLSGKIINHMMSTGEWWNFLPGALSPFGYNETIAHEYYPLSQDESQILGMKWRNPDETSSYHGEYWKPLPIQEYNEKIVGYEAAQKNIDDVLNGIFKCEVTQKPFKIIKQELIFYIENGVSLPTRHPDQRHKERMTLRNPRQLYDRACAECWEMMVTTYLPDRKEKVVCEKCYLKLVY